MSALVRGEFGMVQLEDCYFSPNYFRVAEKIIWVSTNCMLNKFCKVKNDLVRKTNEVVKQKLCTLSVKYRFALLNLKLLKNYYNIYEFIFVQRTSVYAVNWKVLC